MIKQTILLSLCASALAQDMHHMHNMNRAGMYLMNMASGTSMNPYSSRIPMIMTESGNWALMFMGQGFLVNTQQSGPRGGDKWYSPNWFMTSAIHPAGPNASFMLEAMLSLEPATITNRSYPLLFQTGETAFGRPLIDAQHPHDFIMSLGIQYANRLTPDTMLQFYYAPVGDPALGPVAFPHRVSALEIPQATLGHHWQDSTHIANNVATVAVRYKWLRLEGSGFYGAEPNENRWNIDWGGMDSYSGRVSVAPTQNWMIQASAGHLSNPERNEPGNVTRVTASAAYTRNGWSSSVIWGRNIKPEHGTNSWLAETVFPFRRRNYLTGRIEIVDKDELSVPGVHRVQTYIAGYTRDVGDFKHVQPGLGANISAYLIPDALRAVYGDHPFGVNIYLRLRLK
jgi:hypothetical protein